MKRTGLLAQRASAPALYEESHGGELCRQLSLAAEDAPKLEEYLTNLFGGCVEPSVVSNIREIASVDAGLWSELGGVAMRRGLCELASWLALIEPGEFLCLAGGFAQAGRASDIARMAVACNFEGCAEIPFRIEDAPRHEVRLRAEPVLLARAFLLASLQEAAGPRGYLVALAPNKEIRIKALHFACRMASPRRGDLFKLLYADVDEAAIRALKQGDFATASELYYYAKDKAAFLETTIARRCWHVPQALVAAGLLRFDAFAARVNAVAPELLDEAFVAVAPSDLDDYLEAEISAFELATPSCREWENLCPPRNVGTPAAEGSRFAGKQQPLPTLADFVCSSLPSGSTAPPAGDNRQANKARGPPTFNEAEWPRCGKAGPR